MKVLPTEVKDKEVEMVMDVWKRTHPREVEDWLRDNADVIFTQHSGHDTEMRIKLNDHNPYWLDESKITYPTLKLEKSPEQNYGRPE